MTSVTIEPKPHHYVPAPIRASSHDRAASWLVALLVLFGGSVAMLLAVWLAGRIRPTVEIVYKEIPDVGGGSPTGTLGESMQIESPNKDDIARETDIEQPELQNTLEAVVDAVGANQAELADPNLTDSLDPGGPSGASTGDGRAVGLGFGSGEPGFPRQMRWEVVFPEGATLQEYAAALDSFGLELGAIGKGDVHYAFNLSKTPPDKRTGPRAAETRLYMSWTSGNLKQADRSLLTRAGIATDGRVIVQFYPPNIENMLANLEEAYQGRKAGQIRKTVFGVRNSGGKYEFFVFSQTPL